MKRKADLTEMTMIRWAPREKKALEQQAKREGMDVADYVRGAVITMMALDGNVEAMRIIFAIGKERLRERLLRTFQLQRS